MILRLSSKMEELMTEVIRKRRPDLLGLLVAPQDTKLSDSQIDELREAVADEFCETGLTEDDEPNESGLSLEDIIGRLRLS